MANDQADAPRVPDHAVLREFLAACEQDQTLAVDYLDARERWHAATSEEATELADDALIDVLERFSDVRGSELTSAEVRTMRMLRNRPDR